MYIPILFQTAMVQGIDADLKDNTRRISGLELVNDEPDYYTWCNEYNQMDIPRKAIPYDERFYYAFTGKYNNSTTVVTHCPYGKPGDILWVRETWAYCTKNGGHYLHKAEDSDVATCHIGKGWKPSIFMPKDATRFFLRVKSVRPERVADISEKDAKKEGVLYYGDESGDYKNYEYNDKNGDDWGVQTAKESFASLWQSINGKPKPIEQKIDGKKQIVGYIVYPFNEENNRFKGVCTYRGKPLTVVVNPWVWRVEFEKVAKPAEWPL